MAEDQKSGRRVRHPSYGLGTVQSVERGGLSLRVLFDQYPGLAISMPARLLRLAEGGNASAAPKPKKSKRRKPAKQKRKALSRKLSDKQRQERQVLEALRLGVVPMEGLLAYTVGRDAEVDSFERMLGLGERGRAMAILGDYGTGKTHMLELMQHMALSQGWVVGRAWLDPQEAPPSKPRRVYSVLARAFVYPDQREAGECGLAPLFDKAASHEHLREGRIGKEGGRHLFLSPALRYGAALDDEIREDPASIELGELATLHLDWIEARATGVSQELQRRLHARLSVRDKVYALSDFGTLPRVYGYQVSGLAQAVRDLGYKGLLLLLDETELFSNLDHEERDRAIDVFRVLLAAALPQSGEASLDVSEVRKGGRGVIRDLPPRFGDDSRLAIALAATPGSASEDFLRETLGEARVHELTSFGDDEYREMADRILALYLGAYPGINRRVLAALESRVEEWLATRPPRSPREFGRRVVDFLDQVRHTNVDFM
ncbi:MAG: hypothetical protein CSA62_01445 [Planctomycetota bacterium]|nr:MAG: hypothetical protein CSA62_01445 [Planctomycetota bacterium]